MGQARGPRKILGRGLEMVKLVQGHGLVQRRVQGERAPSWAGRDATRGGSRPLACDRFANAEPDFLIFSLHARRSLAWYDGFGSFGRPGVRLVTRNDARRCFVRFLMYVFGAPHSFSSRSSALKSAWCMTLVHLLVTTSLVPRRVVNGLPFPLALPWPFRLALPSALASDLTRRGVLRERRPLGEAERPREASRLFTIGRTNFAVGTDSATTRTVEIRQTTTLSFRQKLKLSWLWW